MFTVLATLFALSGAAFGLSCPVWIPGILLPHPERCDKFYSCSYGVLNEFDCPKGLEYSVWSRRCLWPHEAWCIIRTPQPEEPQVLDDVCTIRDPERYLLPYPGDCGKFLYCIDGKATPKSCPEGTHFNKIFMVCQDPFFAGCDRSLLIKPEGSHLICPKFPSSVVLPHPETCSQFYVCDHGVPYVFDCPQGLQYSVWQKKCVYPSESRCFRIGDLLPWNENQS